VGAWNANREYSRWHEAPLSLIYSVLTAILFGAVLTDTTYAAVLRSVLTPEQKQHVYGIVSDSMPMILVSLLGLACGVLATVMASGNRRARWMLGISVALLLLGNVLIPLLMPHVRVDDSPGLGPLLRIALHALVVLLAVLGCLSWRSPLRYS
jgi:cytochrome bd-type quinol oxidase subunit 2